MNKLRKQDPSSPYASPTKSGAVVSTIKFLNNDSNDFAAESQPLTAREQFWATRALKAEALLNAQQNHHRELKTLTYSQEVKRTRELETMMQQHREKHVYLERLVIVLAIVAVVLVLVIIYLATHLTRHAQAQQRPWWAGLPSHFTIPILSPFTSVVEQESSVFGTKAIAIITMVLGVVAYMIFRHWFNSRSTTQT